MNQKKTHEELKRDLIENEKQLRELRIIGIEIRKQLEAVCPHKDTYMVDSWGSIDDEVKYKCRNCYGYITKEQNDNKENN